MIAGDDNVSRPEDVDAIAVLPGSAIERGDTGYAISRDEGSIGTRLRPVDEDAAIAAVGDGVARDREAATVDGEDPDALGTRNVVVADATAAASEVQAVTSRSGDGAIVDRQLLDTIEIDETAPCVSCSSTTVERQTGQREAGEVLSCQERAGIRCDQSCGARRAGKRQAVGQGDPGEPDIAGRQHDRQAAFDGLGQECPERTGLVRTLAGPDAEVGSIERAAKAIRQGGSARLRATDGCRQARKGKEEGAASRHVSSGERVR